MRAGYDVLPEPPRQLLRQRRRPAAEVVAEHDTAGLPDVREEADHAARRDLVRLGCQPVRSGAEDRLDLRVHGPDVLRPGSVVEEPEQTTPHIGARLALAGARQLVVARGVALDPQARPRERDPCGRAQRQAQRKRLRAAAGDDLAALRDPEEAAADAHRLEGELLEQAPEQRALAREHVRADTHPVRPALDGLDAAAHQIVRFEHERVEVAQLPGGGQAGDAGADDDDVLHALVACAFFSGTRPDGARSASSNVSRPACAPRSSAASFRSTALRTSRPPR